MRHFANVAVIDWSGENVARPKGLAVAHAADGAPTLLRPDGGWSRAGVLDWLLTHAEAGTDLQARMFTPRMTEDPATGSATAAAAALLAEIKEGADLRLRVGQGVDMGRPSLLLARAGRQDGAMIAYVGGRCVTAMEGSFRLPSP